MGRQINFAVDGYVLLLLDKNLITGYVTYGQAEPGMPQVIVHEDLLPKDFFKEFKVNKYKYYSSPEEIIINPDYKDPQQEELEQEEKPQQSTTGSKSVEQLMDELQSIKDMQNKILELLMRK
ncbi:virion component [Staphylococcus phage Twort]|uniref:Virion component n=2 Tax=Staphylococcus phage Twort (strain DSM 17442 / HER 48) TaxID=2908167 RepID=A0A6H0X5D1_BPTWO|nr:tail fiber protein [Staphylococcus phage Twort]AAX92400.1 ORF107 [Staphylococcus phage Twort]QIW89125.1 virion component [Staphylococcus phage Twort]